MKRFILIVLIVVVLLGKGLAQEANVLPLVLKGTSKADLDLQTADYVEVDYYLSPESEAVFEELAERVWRIQEQCVLMLGGTGEPLPGKLLRRAELFVQVFVNGEPMWDAPQMVHPQKDAILITTQGEQVLQALKSSLGKTTDLDSLYLAELANYLAGNLSAINMNATSYAVEGYGEVIDSSGTWTGEPVASPYWYREGGYVAIDDYVLIKERLTVREPRYDVGMELRSFANYDDVRIGFKNYSMSFNTRAQIKYTGAYDLLAIKAHDDADISIETEHGDIRLSSLYSGDIRLSAVDIRLSAFSVYLPGGRFGIGTSEPAARFHLVEEDKNAVAKIESNNGGARLILDGSDNDSNSTVEFQMNNNYKGSFGFDSINDYLYIHHGGDVVVKNGRLGVGTVAPATRFHLVDGANAVAKIESNDGGARLILDGAEDSDSHSAVEFQMNNDYKGSFGFNNTNDYLFIDHGGEVVVKNGRLGVGINEPATRFHLVEEDKNAVAKIESNNGYAKLRLDGTTSSSTVEFQMNNNYKGSFGCNNTNDYLFIYHGGNVVVKNGRLGVGTTTPQGKLDVNGTIYQRGAQIHAKRAFNKDANLESIAEHAENMRREQRLPAIPAPEMLQDGSTMVELSQQRQGIIEELEKAHIYIEQLHLYVEQLQRETQELRKLISRQ